MARVKQDNSKMNPAPCMRPKEVAAFLGCGVSTLWLWVKQGRIPQPKRIGARFTVWQRADIESFVSQMEA